MTTGCTLFETSSREQTPRQTTPASNGILNAFNPPGQLTVSDKVYSIHLHRKNSPGSAPFLELNRNQQLQLRFETLGYDSQQFQVRFTHHNPDWSNSGIPPEFFMDGFQSLYLSGGELSRDTRSSYRQFIFDFPNSDFSFRHSGNYMLHVEDAETEALLFTIPFFVYENRGSISSSVESQVVPRRNLRTTHYPVSRYSLPEEIDQPQFDLKFYYVQNRFWGKQTEALELDFSAPDHVQFEMKREQGFTGDYEFKWLSIPSISQTVQQIAEVDFSDPMPLVILNDDAEGFSQMRPPNSSGRSGRPDFSLNAQYAEFIFRFTHQQDLPEDAEIYLVGDFNQWAIQTVNKLHYSDDIDRWQTTAILKPGNYHYKYVLLRNNRIDDLIFDTRFEPARQEYHAFVYMRDPTRQTYRLIQVNHFYKDE